MKKTIPLTTIILLLLFACEPKIEEFLTINGNITEISMNANEEVYVMTMEASQFPRVTENSKWLSIETENTEGTRYTARFASKTNMSTEERTCLVTVTVGEITNEITVSQKAMTTAELDMKSLLKKISDNGEYEVDEVSETDGIIYVRFTVHPVIEEYEFLFPEGIDELKIDMDRNSIKSWSITSGELAFRFRDGSRISIKMKDGSGKEEDNSEDEKESVSHTLTASGPAEVTCRTGQTETVLEYITDLPCDSLKVEADEEWVKATLESGRISLILDLNDHFEDRTSEIRLSALTEGLSPLVWQLTQQPTIVTPEGMVEFEDIRFKKAVVEKYDTDNDRQISEQEALAIRHLDASGLSLTSVKGIEPMRNLSTLDITGNNLTPITKKNKIRKSTGEIVYSNIYDHTKIGKLDLSDPHPYLYQIGCDGGISIDFTGCTRVVYVNLDRFWNRTMPALKSDGTGGCPLFGSTAREDQIIINTTACDHPDEMDANTYKDRYCTWTYVPDNYVSTDFSRDRKLIQIQKHTKGIGIKATIAICHMRDVDIESDLDDFMINETVEAMFECEPYKSYRECFDVYCLTYVQDERDETVPLDILSEVMVNIQVIPHNEAGKGLADGETSFILYAPTETNNEAYKKIGKRTFSGIVRHEWGGHNMGNLADEYIPNYQSHIEEGYNESHTADPEKVKWNRFLRLPQYHDHVGIYEGCVVSKGCYKSAIGGIMNKNYNYYNAVSRYAIYRQIMIKSGLLYETCPEITEEEKQTMSVFEIWNAHEDFFFSQFIEEDKKELERLNNAGIPEEYEKSKDKDLSWEYKQQFKDN